MEGETKEKAMRSDPRSWFGFSFWSGVGMRGRRGGGLTLESLSAKFKIRFASACCSLQASEIKQADKRNDFIGADLGTREKQTTWQISQRRCPVYCP